MNVRTLLGTLLAVPVLAAAPLAAQVRPNLLFAIADDWGHPHAGAYGDPAARTPTFDRLAREGVLFEHAYVASPSCTPSRNAILSGRHPWSLGAGANLHSRLEPVPVVPHLLEDAGYHVGHMRKSYGPGPLPDAWRGRHPAGRRYPSFQAFLDARPAGAPFCFWLGTSDPHRPYEAGSGRAAGIDPATVRVPAFLPDHPEVRSDLADYLHEVERFDGDVGQALALLAARGELDDTLVVMTGDHGMPFPRCKSNLYDMGVHVPLAARWGTRLRPGRRVRDFVSLVDLAPTFLEVAGLEVDDTLHGRSLVPIFERAADDAIEAGRDAVLFGKERHVPAQAAPSMAGYPSRGLRTQTHLLIVNHAPERWPAGVEAGSTHGTPFADCDGGPTKSLLLAERDDPLVRPAFERAFGKRPALELYDLRTDPDQLVNLAARDDVQALLATLRARLDAGLAAIGDPRALGEPSVDFDAFPYHGRLASPNAPRRRTP